MRLAEEGADAVAALGRLDIVVANAGISSWGRFWEMTEERRQDMIDINLTGVWRTPVGCRPDDDRPGNRRLDDTISSVAGLKSLPRRHTKLNAGSTTFRQRSRRSR